jgi:choloylglycine hydrolase
MRRRITPALIAILSAAFSAAGCSTFCLKTGSHVIFGNNYDWSLSEGLVIVNKRGVEKTAVADTLPAHWVSKYGSVTFNQYGREMPTGGMNEAGLCIGVMWLVETQWPAKDGRQAIGELEWVQYQLDNCATVAEVIATDTLLRVSPRAPAPVHYLVADSSGACASIEFLKGKTVIHSGADLPAPVLTNGAYSASVRTLKRYFPFGGRELIADNGTSDSRFARAAELVQRGVATPPREPVDYAWTVLRKVSLGNGTAWSFVYDVKARCVNFRTRGNTHIRSVCLKEFDFSCATPVKVLDLKSRGSGDAGAQFVDYTEEANRKLIGRTYGATDFLAGLSAEQLDFNAAIPRSNTRCKD